MLMTPTDLDHLFAAAGSAIAQRREEAARRERERRDEGRRRAEQHALAVERACLAAPVIFAWVDGEDAGELRQRMRAASVDLLPISRWLASDGTSLDRGGSFAWRMFLPAAGGLVVEHVGLIAAGNVGYRREHVTAAADLAERVAPAVVLRLADDVRDGRVMDNVAGGLTELTR